VLLLLLLMMMMMMMTIVMKRDVISSSDSIWRAAVGLWLTVVDEAASLATVDVVTQRRLVTAHCGAPVSA